MPEWQRSHSELDVISYSVAISASSKDPSRERAMSLLWSMRCAGLQPGLIAYSAAISSCEKGLPRERALSLMRDMRCCRLRDTDGPSVSQLSHAAAD